jgi:hypothetical protein
LEFRSDIFTIYFLKGLLFNKSIADSSSCLVLYLLRKKGGLLNSLLISANFSCHEIYAQNYGDDFSDYVEFASENYGDGNLADSNNKNLGNTPAEIQRIFQPHPFPPFSQYTTFYGIALKIIFSESKTYNYQ